MSQTPNLGLPYIAAAQAQKHITHNEALRTLDVVVQPSVVNRDLTAPPASPIDGQRHIVAAGASGAWAGKDNNIAAFQDNAWVFYAPSAGWLNWVIEEDKLLVFDAVAWVEVNGGGTGSVNPALLVGVNAVADSTNRLSVNSPASLFNHEGNGHQLKINKAAVADTASVLFQNGFSGRAEMGLTGDDDYRFKVSGDGANWNEAIVIDRSSGAVSFPNSAFYNGGTNTENLLVNGDFVINQRGFSGGGLTAGIYGHDRWKAGTGGSNYTVSNFVVTLSGGELVQVIEPALWGVENFAQTQMVFSVESPSADLTITVGSVSGVITAGTGRRSVSLLTTVADNGSLAVSLKSTSGGTANFSRLKLEVGAQATPWQPRPFYTEVALCQRYYTKSFPIDVAPANALEAKSYLGFAPADNFCDTDFLAFPVEMRTTPTVTLYAPPDGTPVDFQWATFIAGTGWTYPSTTTAPSFALSSQGMTVRQSGGLGTIAAKAYQCSGNYTVEAEL